MSLLLLLFVVTVQKAEFFQHVRRHSEALFNISGIVLNFKILINFKTVKKKITSVLSSLDRNSIEITQAGAVNLFLPEKTVEYFYEETAKTSRPNSALSVRARENSFNHVN